MMKKLFLLAAGLALILTACQKDEGFDPVGMDYQTITVTLPQPMQTRATADDFGDGSLVDRCLLQVYRNNQPYGEQQVATVTGKKATFTLRLVAQQAYDFVFWADCSTGDHYATEDLTDITVKGDYTGNNDAFDAFTGTLLNYEVAGAFQENITLRRPFGQLNVKTLDIASIPDAALKPTQVKVAFRAVPTSYNAYTGLVGEQTSAVEYTSDVLSENGDLTVDYFWAPVEEAALADFAITFYNGANEISTKENFNNIPIRRNYRTNVSGNLLTKQGSFSVTIDPVFEGEYTSWDGVTYEEVIPVTETIDGVETEVYHVMTSAQFAWMLKNSASKKYYIRLNSDIDLAGYECPQVSSFSGTLDGENHVIKGLKISTGSNRGLFNTLSNGGVVRNLVFESGEVTASQQAGLIASSLSGTTLIENCVNKGVIVTGLGNCAGGFVAKAYGSSNTIKNCTNYGEVHSNVKCGGIVGIASGYTTTKTVLTGCKNYGRVYGAASAGNGGILGYAGKEVTIDDCHNYGEVGNTTERFSAGIVGYTQVKEPDLLSIKNCSNNAVVKGASAGGILGASGNNNDNVHVEGCVNEGEIIGADLAGGIAAGAAIGEILNCDNNAKVSALNNGGRAGGVVGHLYRATVSGCHGGVAEIAATYPGRQLGSFSCGPDIMAYLDLPTDGTDSYDNEQRSIGAVAPFTALAFLTVTGGELKGLPLSGGNNGTITIREDASWDAFPGETGSWRVQNNNWTKLP